MNGSQYLDRILHTPFSHNDTNGTDGCRFVAEVMIKSCGIQFPLGQNVYDAMGKYQYFSHWTPLGDDFSEAQRRANDGMQVIVLTRDAAAIVTPNGGNSIAGLGDVLVSMDGPSGIVYQVMLADCWPSEQCRQAVFFYYNPAHGMRI